MDLGDKILEEFSDIYNASKASSVLGVDTEIQKEPKLILGNKKLARYKSIISKGKDKKINFKTNTSDNFSHFLNTKIPKLKMTFKEFLSNTPKCDLCDKTGITLPELKKMNSTSQIDSVVLEYVLYRCTNCRVFVHKNCLDTNEDTKLEILNIKDIDYFNFNCDKCKLDTNKKNLSFCGLCNKNEKDLKHPHLFQKTENFEWVHSLCLLWKYSIQNVDLEPENDRMCYKCQDENSVGFSLKCYANECTKFFHPICMRECLSYYNLTAVDDLLYGVIFCEEHSKIYFINTLKNVFK